MNVFYVKGYRIDLNKEPFTALKCDMCLSEHGVPNELQKVTLKASFPSFSCIGLEPPKICQSAKEKPGKEAANCYI